MIVSILRIIVIFFFMMVALELGVHIIYHAVTGKAGLYDPPFNYLKDIYGAVKKWLQ